MDGRIRQRRSDFKKGFGDAKKRRDDTVVAIRKAERDAMIAAKREAHSQNVASASTTAAATEATAALVLRRDQAVSAIMSCDHMTQKKGLLTLKDCLAMVPGSGTPHDLLVPSGELVKRLQYFVTNQSQDKVLRQRALSVLTSLTGGSSAQTRAVVEQGGIPFFVELLAMQPTNLYVASEALGNLANIAGDSEKHKHEVLRAGAVGAFLRILETASDEKYFKRCAWMISNLTLPSSGALPFAEFVPLLRYIAKLTTLPDLEIRQDCAVAIARLAKNAHSDEIDMLLSSGVIDAVCEVLKTAQNSIIRVNCLQAIGFVVAGRDEQAGQIVSNDACLAAVRRVLSAPVSDHPLCSRVACWIVANIAAGTEAQLQRLVDFGLVGLIVQHLTPAVPTDVMQQVIFAVQNGFANGTFEQVETFLHAGTTSMMANLLSTPKATSCLNELVECLTTMLAKGERFLKLQQCPWNGHHSSRFQMTAISGGATKKNPIAVVLHEEGVFEKLEELQCKGSKAVFHQIETILRSYSSESREEEDREFAASGVDASFTPFGKENVNPSDVRCLMTRMSDVWQQ